MAEKLTPEQIKKINQLQKNFSKGLIKAGVRGIRSAFKLNPKVVQSTELKKLLDKHGFKSISFADGKYWVIDWTDWLNIIKFDWENEVPWIAERYDCENHAFHFSSRTSNWFLINTAGVAFGTVMKKYGHAYNVIVAYDENKELAVYLYEPETDGWAKIGTDNQLNGIKVDSWIYRTNWIIFY